jgi:hypothetical protein
MSNSSSQSNDARVKIARRKQNIKDDARQLTRQEFHREQQEAWHLEHDCGSMHSAIFHLA